MLDHGEVGIVDSEEMRYSSLHVEPELGPGEDPENGDSYPLTHSREDGKWMLHAVCRGQTELFFGPAGEQPRVRQAREAQAKKLCAVCPVQLSCLESGRRNHEHGVWGGENDEERTFAGYTPRRLARRSITRARRSTGQMRAS